MRAVLWPVLFAIAASLACGSSPRGPGPSGARDTGSTDAMPHDAGPFSNVYSWDFDNVDEMFVAADDDRWECDDEDALTGFHRGLELELG